MRSGRAARGFVTGLLAGVIGGALPAQAAPNTSEHDLPVRPIGVRDVGGWIEFEYEYEAESRTGGGSVDRETERSEFAEAIEVNTHSYIYHPYVADLLFDVGLRAEQGRHETVPAGPVGTEGQDALADLIRADLTLAKMKPVVTHLFYHRLQEDQNTDTTTNTTLARGFELNTTSYGGDLRFSHDDWPTSVYLARTVSEGIGAARTDEEGIAGLLTMNNDGEALDTRLTLRYDDTMDHFRGTTAEAMTGSLRQNLAFGPGGRHHLNSDVRYFDETGTTPREQLDVSEAVSVAIDDRWHARAVGTYQTVDLSTDSIDTWTARGSLTHQLHGSLNTQVQVRTSQTDTLRSESDEVKAELNFRYRKRVPHGVLSAGLHFSQLYEDERSSDGRRPVNDESLTYGTGVPQLLANPDVILTTVVVTDTAGVVTYIDGIDYLLVPRGDLTEVLRLVTGGIPPDGTVLVDYKFRVAERLATESFSVGTSARLSLWQWLSLYGHYENENRTLTEGIDTSGRAEDTETWLAGIETTYDALTLIGELEHFDSGLSAYDRRSLQAHYSRDVNSRWNAFGTAIWAVTAFDEPPDDITTVDLRLGLHGHLGRWGRAEVDTWVRTESGRSNAQDTTSTGVRAVWDWSIRKVNGRLRYVHIFEDDASGQRLERDELSISVRRRF